jgi:predicted metal-binding membrane protein
MAEIAHQPRLAHLPAAEARLEFVLGRPMLLAAGCVVALTVLGWAYLGLMLAQTGSAESAAGPGYGVPIVDAVAADRFGTLGREMFDLLCQPTLGVGTGGHVGMLPVGTWSAVDFALVFLMWCAMALAMMLPSAGPMIMTYAEIADTAARRGIGVVSPLVLTAGYLAVWLGFSLGATLLQRGLAWTALMDAGAATLGPSLSGGVFVAAGIYQFSALKRACLTHCQRPFPYFFANWSTEPRRILRLGLRQGLYCLGCCWAMMLLMLAVGVMNVIWMVIIGVIMTIEKMSNTNRLSRAVGVALVVAGLAFLGTAAADQWASWRD